MIFVLEIIGTIAFALSGAATAIEKKMDIFGVVILGMTTATGGGIIRDLILGINPPAAFNHPVYALTAIVVSIILFIPYIREKYKSSEVSKRTIFIFMDALGLGIFTVVGVKAALTTVSSENLFLAVFTGVVTGVGGGVLRDVMAQNIPSIFVRHFYACAAIVGALSYILCIHIFSTDEISIILSVVVTVSLRMLAFKYKWSLPRA